MPDLLTGFRVLNVNEVFKDASFSHYVRQIVEVLLVFLPFTKDSVRHHQAKIKDGRSIKTCTSRKRIENSNLKSVLTHFCIKFSFIL